MSVTYKMGQSDFSATSGANRYNASFWRLFALVTTKLRPRVPLPLSTKKVFQNEPARLKNWKCRARASEVGYFAPGLSQNK